MIVIIAAIIIITVAMQVEDECGDIPMVLVQNKIDLITQAHVSSYEVEKMAMESRMKLYKTSVKEDLNVDLVFQHLAENYVKKVRIALD